MTASTVSEWPRLTGRQEPHFLSEWPGDETEGEKAVELGRRVGKKSMPWQSTTLRSWMRRRPDGLWTNRSCVLIVSRQNGKTLLVILRILFGLFVINDRKGERIVYSAQRWATSEDVYKRTWAIIERRPWLRRRIVAHTCSGGRGYLETSAGARAAFVTRSADLGKGFDEVDLVIYDEAYNLTDVQRGALNPTQLASTNPQTIYLSTAVDEETMPNGEVLATMRQRGLDGEEELDFREWMAPESMPDGEQSTWEYANPSFGVIHQPRDLREELRNATSARARRLFHLEYLGRGRWPSPDGRHIPTIPADVWSAMKVTKATPVGPCALALDRSMDRKWWTLAAAQRTAEGRIHIEIGYFQSASNSAVVAFIVALVALRDPSVLVIDGKSPANVLEALLREAGIEPEMTNASKMAVASSGFLDDALEGVLSHTDQWMLNDAVADVTQHFLPQGDFVWSKISDGVVSPLIAATLARWGLLTFGVETAPRALPSTGSTTTSSPHRAITPLPAGRRAGDLDLMSVGF